MLGNTTMERRGFLKLLGGAVLGAAGSRVYSFPSTLTALNVDERLPWPELPTSAPPLRFEDLTYADLHNLVEKMDGDRDLPWIVSDAEYDLLERAGMVNGMVLGGQRVERVSDRMMPALASRHGEKTMRWT